MEARYTVTVTNTGGRSGEVHDAKSKFSLKIAPPGSDADGATNPEQLFAAGYSACFNGALSLALRQARIKADSTVSVTVSLFEREAFDYYISADIEGHIDGLSKEETEKFLEKAHHICPYSKAVQGNIHVNIKAV